MKEIELEIGFTTPAFLGNANQDSQWRTPPFKALLRQWWRVVKAKEVACDYKKLLVAENELFGKAADEGKSTKSLLRIRLNNWNLGKLDKMTRSETVKHPEVKDNKGQVGAIGANLYLGYGPITTKGIKNESNAITPVNESATIWLGFPDQFHEEITQTIHLMSWFGTLGSRSRNGWGSMVINKPIGMDLKPLNHKNLMEYCRNFSACIASDWANAVGKDTNGPLVWQTEPKGTWEEVMKELAEVKIAFRTHFKFDGGGTHQDTQKRHVISYPVTKYDLSGLKNNARLANQIRFKVEKTTTGAYRAIIFHMPCRAPDDSFLEKLSPQNQKLFKDYEKTVWPEIHKVLDAKAARLK